MKPTVSEIQNTTTSDNLVNGIISFRLENVPVDTFLTLRGKIRTMLGTGPFVLDHMTVEERALSIENKLDRHPESGVQAIPPPIPSDPMAPDASRPVQKLPGQPPRERTLYITRRMRDLLQPKAGLQQSEIVKIVRDAFPKSRYSIDEILRIYNKIHGIR